MGQEEITDFFVLWVSGAAKMKNEKEIEFKGRYGATFTIEFPTDSPRYAVIREYTRYGDCWERYHVDGYPRATMTFRPIWPIDYIRIDFSVKNGII